MMKTPLLNDHRRSLAMERTSHWVFSQGIETDIMVQVGETTFPLHKFILLAKSNYIRKLVIESREANLATIVLSDIPGGSETFEMAAKFCYGVNFEITVQNVAALRCAAEYLQMTEKYCDNNLANRSEEFLCQVALTNLSSAVVVLKSCEGLFPMVLDLNIVQRCVNVISSKACNEASFPSRNPPNWWTEELSILNISSFQNIITSMRSQGAKTLTIASAIITYSERSLRDLVRDHSGNGIKASESVDSELRIEQRQLLESITTLLPSEKAAFPISFLCSLLRSAIFLKVTTSCKNELEKRISAILEHVTVDDLLVLSITYDGESLFDLESVRWIISEFVFKEKRGDVFNGGNFREGCSSAMQRVVKTLDGYLGEIATYVELTISMFNGIANLAPKGSRRTDDDLYRAIDIYLKAHPSLDEIEREKVCSVIDPLKLSYEARMHASQNKRLPLQIALHALYFDQLKLRSEANDGTNLTIDSTMNTRNQFQGDGSLMKENETLRSELTRMKMYISDIQKNEGASSQTPMNLPKKGTFFSSMSKTLGRLNPFKHGSKDTSHLDDVDITKPRRRRFSIS